VHPCAASLRDFIRSCWPGWDLRVFGFTLDDDAGPLGFCLQDHAGPLRHPSAGKNVRRVAGHQAIENDTKRIDIGGCCDLIAANLLGAGEFRSHGPGVCAIGIEGLEVEFGIEELGDAEVEELGLPFRRDENIGRLQIAMNDELLMSVLDGGADFEKKLEAVLNGERLPIAIVVDGQAVDVLHDEVGQPVFGSAAIEEVGDMGMVEGGEDLSLASEALQVRLGGAGRAYNFDGDILQVVVVNANRLEDGAHSSFANLRDHLVSADLAALPRYLLFVDQSGEEQGLVVEYLDGRLLMGKERFQFPKELRFGGTEFVEKRLALFGVELDCGMKGLFDALPVAGSDQGYRTSMRISRSGW
jgi:hypothetical protein